MARLAGRTGCSLIEVNEIVIEAYNSLEKILLPGKVFKYAETGFEEGGRFRHSYCQHQNGLSVDFMTPTD